MSEDNATRISRRRLLTGAAATAAVTAAAGAGALPRSAVKGWDMRTDVLVAGSGAAGVSAAIEAREAGAEVLLIEALPRFGGSSAMSGGVVYAGGGTALQKALKIEDSVEQMYRFISLAGAIHPPLDKIQLYCEESVAHFDWLVAQGDGAIVLLGQSLGSGVAVNTAAERPAARVILVSAYRSVQSLAQAHYPWLPVAPLMKDPFRSDLRIARVTQPKLFIHGRRDTIIPLSSGEALYRLAPEPKRMLVYDAGHNDIWNDAITAAVVEFAADGS